MRIMTKRLELYQKSDSEDEDRTSSDTMKHVSRVKMSTLLSSKSLHQGPGSSFAMGSSHVRQLAFSSPIETDVVPDIDLMRKFSRISRDKYEHSGMEYITSETMYITEFFISLAICNTVVVSTPEQPSQKRFWTSTPKIPIAPLNEFRKILNKFSIRKLSSSSPAASTSSEVPQSDNAKNIRQKLGVSGLRVRFPSTDVQSPMESTSSDMPTDIHSPMELPNADVPTDIKSPMEFPSSDMPTAIQSPMESPSSDMPTDIHSPMELPNSVPTDIQSPMELPSSDIPTAIQSPMELPSSDIPTAILSPMELPSSDIPTAILSLMELPSSDIPTAILSPMELPSSDVPTDIKSPVELPSFYVPTEGAQKEIVVEGGGNPGGTLEEPSGSTPGPISEPSSEYQLCYEAESPDEAALIHAARAYSCILQSRSPDRVTIDFATLGTLTFQLLHILPFDAVRKRMSVVVRHPILNQVVVYTKGADSVIMDLLQTKPTGIEKVDRRNQKIKEKTQRHLDEYARKGLRTLCIASKVISDSEYQEWLKEHHKAESNIDHREEMLLESALRLENNLTLLGATGIEDRLQEGVPDTIASLRKAGIVIWMLTGDKQETAVNIAHSCQLLEPTDTLFTLKSASQEDCEQLLDRILEEMKICPHAKGSCSTDDISSASVAPIPQLSAGLIIDGPTLAFALNERAQRRFLQLTRQVRAVICCRATPLQKSQLVKLVRKELNVMTLAIGDGANDVSMIQVADVGIGISGQEGMQAVMASDFAISEFKHLKKLLLVHGHWCYTRLANMVLYFFYKNLAYVALLFWYQFFCGFSGMSMTDHWSLMLFNILFTSAPPIIYGIMDKDVSANVLLRIPQLYRASQRSEPYVSSAFFFNLMDAFYQSLACFFICYMTYADSDVDIFSFGEPLDTSIFLIILLHLVIESKSLNWIHVAVLIGSVILYFTFSVFFGAFCVLCNPPANPYWVMQRHLSDPTFYLVCIMSVLVALFPRYIFRVLQGTMFPTPVMKASQLEYQSQVPRKIQPLRNRVSPV